MNRTRLLNIIADAIRFSAVAMVASESAAERFADAFATEYPELKKPAPRVTLVFAKDREQFEDFRARQRRPELVRWAGPSVEKLQGLEADSVIVLPGASRCHYYNSGMGSGFNFLHDFALDRMR